MEEGHGLISQLGLDVETRIKFGFYYYFWRSAVECQLATVLLGCVPRELKGTGICPLGWYGGVTGRSPACAAIPRG